MSEFSILIVEDDESVRRALTLNLEQAGYKIYGTGSPTEGLALQQEHSPQLIFCDFKLPEMDGFSFLKESRKVPGSEVILMSAYSDPNTVTQAITEGAYDHLPKPFSGPELLLAVKKFELRERNRSVVRLQKSSAETTPRFHSGNIVAESVAMKDILATVRRLSSYSTTVLVSGESGTGKELVAQAIHQNSSRRGRPFVAINCGAIPEMLMESELFGHKKGSFTDATRDKKGLFEEANEGTLFLDEIGELPHHLQVKLLRALQEQQIRRVGDEEVISIDVRIIAATHRNLEDDVVEGKFRDDLFYRLNVVSLFIPPLRERTDDIPPLIQAFIKKQAKRLGLPAKTVTAEAMKMLTKYYWKGNVRELENCIERSLVLSESDFIDVDSLPDQVRNESDLSRTAASVVTISDENLSIKQKTRALEISLILAALGKTNGNRTHAAKILEISHRALLYKLKEYGLSDKK